MTIDKLREECGIFGIFDQDNLDCGKLTYYALYALQHRGQESAGIAICHKGGVVQHKNVGLVRDVFRGGEELEKGIAAIGHVRFVRTERKIRQDVQPVVSRYTNGFLAVANNGSVCNQPELTKELELDGAIFQTDTVAELITHLLSKEWVRSGNIERALADVMKRLQGGYAMVIMCPTKVIGARDPMGIRPLSIGKIGDTYMLASETTAFDAIGAEFVRDVEPGEVVKISKHGLTSIKDNCKEKSHLCAFEYIYFARPDSILDGQSVYEIRKNIGALLAKKHPADADVVLGVPFSGLCSAIGYSHESGIPFEYALMKNSYIGRDVPEIETLTVDLKMNAIEKTIEGKRVVLVDDSIVRGNTCKKLIKLLRESGAKEVHLRISSPPFNGPCYYGSYIPEKEELATYKFNQEELCKELGADTIGFLDNEDLHRMFPDESCAFCDACYTGNYIAGKPGTEKKK